MAHPGQITERAEAGSHRDYYTGNVVLRDGLPAALIDFDLAMPTTGSTTSRTSLWCCGTLAIRGTGARVHRRRHPPPGRGVRGRLRHDGSACARSWRLAVDMAPPLSQGFPRLAELDPVSRKLWEDVPRTSCRAPPRLGCARRPQRAPRPRSQPAWLGRAMGPPFSPGVTAILAQVIGLIEENASHSGSTPPNASGAMAMPQDPWHGTPVDRVPDGGS